MAIYCPKCGKPVDGEKPVFQATEPIQLWDLSEDRPMKSTHTLPEVRYCCQDCSFCFIIEEGF